MARRLTAFLGYSMGAGIALETAVRYPELVRKLAVMSPPYNTVGLHPGLIEGVGQVPPEHLVGTPWQVEYASIAPNPDDWPTLVAKVRQLNRNIPERPAEAVQAIEAPTLVVIGDSAVVRPEHAVGLVRLFGGGVVGDLAGLRSPNSRSSPAPRT